MSVLIVSTDKTIKNTLFRLKQDGYHVLTARNEQEALTITENTPIDLLLWDASTCYEEGNQIKRHLKHKDNAGLIELPLPGSYGAELGVDPRIVTALQQTELLKRVRTTLKNHRRPTAANFHHPTLLETISQRSAGWVQNLSHTFTAAPLPLASSPATTGAISQAPSLPSVEEISLPTPQSMLNGLIAFDPSTTAWVYLFLLTLAEVCTFVFKPQIGLTFHGIILILLLTNAAFRWQENIHRLLLGLTFVPLIRILSLALPMISLPRIYWYLIITIPLLIVAVMVVKILGFSRLDIGLSLKQPYIQIFLAPLGLVIGFVYYLILRPIPLITNLVWPDVLIPALIVFISTGLSEELIFRGILQRAATDVMGRTGVLYIAGLYTNLHIGHRSILNPICALLLSLFLGWIVYKTGSIWGGIICHGIINIMLFLIMPFLLF